MPCEALIPSSGRRVRLEGDKLRVGSCGRWARPGGLCRRFGASGRSLCNGDPARALLPCSGAEIGRKLRRGCRAACVAGRRLRLRASAAGVRSRRTLSRPPVGGLSRRVRVSRTITGCVRRDSPAENAGSGRRKMPVMRDFRFCLGCGSGARLDLPGGVQAAGSARKSPENVGRARASCVSLNFA